VNSESALDRLQRNVLLRLKEKGATQKDLAAHLGITSGGLSMMLRGKRKISIKLLDQIGGFFGTTASLLLVDLDPDSARILSPETPGGGGGSSHAETGFLAQTAELERLRILLAQHQHIIREQRSLLGHIAGPHVAAEITRLKDASDALDPAGAARSGSRAHPRMPFAKGRRLRSGGAR
jgi:transcriptional regulator with XRE-family HTH domain